MDRRRDILAYISDSRGEVEVGNLAKFLADLEEKIDGIQRRISRQAD